MTNADFSVPDPSQVRRHGIRMQIHQGVPTLFCGNSPFFGPMYTFDPYSDRPWQQSLQSMYASGVRIFSFLLPLPVAWKPNGGFDFSLLDELHDEILATAPDALLMPRVFLTTPTWWDQQHPEELIGFKGETPKIQTFGNENQPLWKYETKLYHSPFNPSLASRQWRQDAGLALAEYVRHTSAGKYAGHFAGYQIAYGTCGEWGALGSYKDNRFGNYDFSEPMLRCFRKLLQDRYADDAHLQAAWGVEGVTLDSAEPPSKIEKLRTTTGILKDPTTSKRYRDWIDCYSDALFGAMIHFGQVIKAAAPRPALVGTFCGYFMQVGSSVYTNHFAWNDPERIFRSDVIDIISTPNWYENRATGVCSQCCVATVARNKIFMAECDVRTHLGKNAELARTPEQGRATFQRDTFYNLTQGSGHLWWYDFGRGWYLDKEIEKTVEAIVRETSRRPPAAPAR
jgi:hypothetical protein